MSNMSDLDIVLSEYKLSDAQKNAVLEVIGEGYTLAKANTIKSLENKGLIVKVSETHHKLGDELAQKVNPILERNKRVFEEFDRVDEVEAIRVELDTNMWDVSEEAQAVQDIMLSGGDNGDKADSVEDVKLIAEPYAQWELELMGFTGWRNTDDAWTGLTRKEIQADIKTAFGLNRKARRLHTRLLTSEYRKIMCPRPRKSLKITGKVGV